MKKKAQIEFRTMAIVIVLVIVVLVIVIGGYALTSQQFLDYFGNTKFQEENITIKEIAYIRYDISKDKVQYYDSTSWNDFPQNKETVLDNKKISEDALKLEFSKLYYTRNFPATLILVERNNKKIKELQGWESGRAYKKEFIISGFSQEEKGAVFIETMHTSARNDPNRGESKTRFRLSLDNNLCEYIGLGDLCPIFKYLDSPEYEIIGKTAEWRDAVLKNPISINYKTLNENEFVPKTETFCIQKIDDIYLNINLNEPKTSC
ncbi:MAG: hypothetical protein AABY10_01470 [Nanoarchaeota archaeon]